MQSRNAIRTRHAYAMLLLLVARTVTPSSTSKLMWHYNKLYDDLLPLDVVVASPGITAETEINCARLCQAEGWCNTFFYKDVSRLCKRQRLVYVTSPSGWASSPGWRYFQLESKPLCPARNVYIPDRLSSTCYRIHLETQKTWIGARDACAASGEMLAVLEPVTKAYFITDFFKVNTNLTHNNYFIGARRPSFGNAFVWLNGQAVNNAATRPFWTPNKSSKYPVSSSFVVLLVEGTNISWTESYGNPAHHYICERRFWGSVKNTVSKITAV